MTKINRRALLVILLITSLLSSTSCEAISDFNKSINQQPTPTATQQSKPTPTYTETVPPVIALPALTSGSLVLVYQDDFSNPARWSTSTTEEINRFFDNGQYCFSVNKSGAIYASRTSALGEQSNFVLTIDARTISANNDSSYGIEFRRDPYSFFRFFSSLKARSIKVKFDENHIKKSNIHPPHKAKPSVQRIMPKCCGCRITAYNP